MAALLVHDLNTGGGRRTSTRGRTRRSRRCTVGCGGRRTTRAARWAWRPCSASRPVPDGSPAPGIMEGMYRPTRPARPRQPPHRRGEGDPGGHPEGLPGRRRPVRRAVVRAGRPARARELAREFGKVGLLGMHSRATAAPGSARSPTASPAWSWRRATPASGRWCRCRVAGDVRHLAVRHRGAEAGVAAADGGRRGDRLLRPDRARPRLRPGVDDAPARAASGERLGARRRRRCGSPTGPVADVAVVWARRRGDGGIRGFVVPTGHPGVHGARDPAQDVAARLGHRRARARRRPAAARCHACPSAAASRVRWPA